MLSLLALVLALLHLHAQHAAAPLAASRWVQDRFAISAWVGPIVPVGQFDATYQEYADANFTVILGNFAEAYDPDKAGKRAEVIAQLDACEKSGLKALVSTCESCVPPFNVTTPGGCVNIRHPALWGHTLSPGEPQAFQFSQMALWSANIAKRRPDLLRYTNLLPNYATSATLNSSSFPLSYGEYLQEFVRVVRPQVLSFDHYPHFRQWGGSASWPNCSKEGYLKNLDAVRATGVPFWTMFNALPYGGHSDPTEAELRWQAFSALAYGARGVTWFCYWTPPGAPYATDGGIITPKRRASNASGPVVFKRGVHYAHAQRINGVLRVFGGFLLRAASTGIFYRSAPCCSSSQSARLPAASTVIAAVNDTGAGPGFEFLLGEFRTEHGDTAVLLHNQDHTNTLLASLTFVTPSDVQRLKEVDASSGAIAGVWDDAPDSPGLQLLLEAGAARLLVLLSLPGAL